jgi:hypothetical protein
VPKIKKILSLQRQIRTILPRLLWTDADMTLQVLESSDLDKSRLYLAVTDGLFSYDDLLAVNSGDLHKPMRQLLLSLKAVQR